MEATGTERGERARTAKERRRPTPMTTTVSSPQRKHAAALRPFLRFGSHVVNSLEFIYLLDKSADFQL